MFFNFFFLFEVKDNWGWSSFSFSVFFTLSLTPQLDFVAQLSDAQPRPTDIVVNESLFKVRPSCKEQVHQFHVCMLGWRRCYLVEDISEKSEFEILMMFFFMDGWSQSWCHRFLLLFFSSLLLLCFFTAVGGQFSHFWVLSVHFLLRLRA